MEQLIHLFWRDPDPLWRWASGQYARRWWKRPAIHALIGAILILIALGIVIVFTVRVFGELSDGARKRDAEMMSLAGAMLTGGISLYLCLRIFISASSRPFFERSPGQRLDQIP